MVGSQPWDTTRSVERAADVLDCFIDAPLELGVTDISRQLSLSKGTVHRLLASLAKKGLIATNSQTQKYRLGMKILELASTLQSKLDIRQLARPFMNQLGELSEETVSLHVRTGNAKVCIDQVVSRKEIRLFVEVGRIQPLHMGSSGKVLVAYSSQDDQDSFLSDGPLAALTPHTVVDTTEWRRIFQEIRERGFATSVEEAVVGLSGMAVPILDYSNTIVASISISGPSYRWTLEQMLAFAPQAIAIAEQLSSALGYQGRVGRTSVARSPARVASAP